MGLYLPVGPQHPIHPEATLIKLKVEGEHVVDADIDASFVHRGVEKALEHKTYVQRAPAAYSSAPIPLLVTMTIAEGIGGWALVTLLSFTAPSVLSVAWFRLPLLALAAFTAVYGSLAALAQRDPRRLLAYSSVSQGGYLLLGIACGGDVAAASALLLFAAHSSATLRSYRRSATSRSWEV